MSKYVVAAIFEVESEALDSTDPRLADALFVSGPRRVEDTEVDHPDFDVEVFSAGELLQR